MPGFLIGVKDLLPLDGMVLGIIKVEVVLADVGDGQVNLQVTTGTVVTNMPSWVSTTNERRCWHRAWKNVRGLNDDLVVGVEVVGLVLHENSDGILSAWLGSLLS